MSNQTQDAMKASRRCEMCGAKGSLIFDSRVPYEIAGGVIPKDVSELMALCDSCDQGKSWTCEHCPNWVVKSKGTCETCMWTSPTSYSHVATEQRRRITVELTDSELIELYDQHAPSLETVLAEWLRAHKFQ